MVIFHCYVSLPEGNHIIPIITYGMQASWGANTFDGDFLPKNVENTRALNDDLMEFNGISWGFNSDFMGI
jgi:hypothetical protein